MKVLIVNSKNEVIDTIDKNTAHLAGIKHLAFSIFIFNKKGELLISKRAADKYHSPSLWSNSVCGHFAFNLQRFDEQAHRRLLEELGFYVDIKEIGKISYDLDVGGGMRENEHTTIFAGIYKKNKNTLPIKPNPQEVSEILWVDLDHIKGDVIHNPWNYTEWFKLMINDSSTYDLLKETAICSKSRR